MIANFFLESACCPKCQGGLTSKSGQLNCANCRIRFPAIDGTPWLFAYPEAVMGEWRNRSKLQLETMYREVVQLEGLAANATMKSTQDRLNAMAAAMKFNMQFLSELLKPIAIQGKASLDVLQALKSELPLGQKLMGYYTNLHRDWCWGDAEHLATLDLVKRLMGESSKWGRVLVLGAGAGRFAYDVANLGAEVVVALDFNPLLVGFGSKVSGGTDVTYYEFPVAPLGATDAAVAGVCKAPSGAKANLLWLMADGLNPPFKDESFDVVVTPWFIDVIPQNLQNLANQINRLLKPKARWLNFGPYGFLSASAAGQLSPPEIMETVTHEGFKEVTHALTRVPYLQSPHSAQQRSETILGFLAEKVASRPKPTRFNQYPKWLEDTSVPIPAVEKLQTYAFATSIQSQVLAQMNGKRSINDLAQGLAIRSQLESEEALSAVVTLFRKLWDGDN